MSRIACFIIVAGVAGGIISANGESLLKAASFPTPFSDLSFVTRMDVLAEGYDDLETVYDEDTGQCISGCAYPGITIEKETEEIERNIRLANVVSNVYANFDIASNIDNDIGNDSVDDADNVTDDIDDESNVSTDVNSTQYQNTFTQYLQNLVPYMSPVNISVPTITSDFGPRTPPIAGKTSSFHKGIDISVGVGTPVYSTADGVIESVRENNSKGGKYIIVRHGNTGFRTGYFHLSNNRVLNVGDAVRAGQLIAYSGNTGPSTGPHLHYAIYYTGAGKTFNSSMDAIDPLWPKNMLKSNYRFKNSGAKSCRHKPNAPCRNNRYMPSTTPVDPLPGEIK